MVKIHRLKLRQIQNLHSGIFSADQQAAYNAWINLEIECEITFGDKLGKEIFCQLEQCKPCSNMLQVLQTAGRKIGKPLSITLV